MTETPPRATGIARWLIIPLVGLTILLNGCWWGHDHDHHDHDDHWDHHDDHHDHY